MECQSSPGPPPEVDVLIPLVPFTREGVNNERPAPPSRLLCFKTWLGPSSPQGANSQGLPQGDHSLCSLCPRSSCHLGGTPRPGSGGHSSRARSQTLHPGTGQRVYKTACWHLPHFRLCSAALKIYLDPSRFLGSTFSWLTFGEG